MDLELSRIRAKYKALRLGRVGVKNAGTCKQGERADLTGCTPAVVNPKADPSPFKEESAPVEVEEDEEEYDPEDMVPRMSKKVIDKLGESEKKIINKYTGILYKTLNKSMRQCPPDFQCLDDATKKQYEEIEAVLAKAPKFKEPVQVFRGIAFDSQEKLQALVDVMTKARDSGEAYTMGSIVSTSIIPDVGEGFADSPFPVTFEIMAKRGLYVASISNSPREHEVMQSAKTKYKVTKVVQKGKNTTIFMEEL